MSPDNSKSKSLSSKARAFDAQAFLDSAGVAKKVRQFKRAEIIFSQGAAAESVMYIQEGGVKITAVSASGKEAIIAVLGPGEFFGEGCLAGQTVRMGNATATTPSTVLAIDKKEMQNVLHEQHDISDLFINFVLTRNIRIEEDLVDQLFNSTEKRLVRKARPPAESASKSFARNAGGDDRHHAHEGEFVHEQIQEAGFHQIQRRD